MPPKIGSRSAFASKGWILFLVILVVGLLAIAALFALAYDSVEELVRDWRYGLMTAALVAVVALSIEVVRDLRAGARLRQIARLRPGATVRPVQSFGSMTETATRLRVEVNGVGYSEWSCQALAILPEHVEFWATTGNEPRWSVARVTDGIALARDPVGMRILDLIKISDGESSATIEVRPVPQPIWLSYLAKHRQRPMEQLICNLGEDPSRILVDQ